ncbi:MAG TPA: winged helix-turn-helix domain-containing protein [Solirubrobacterales bacterium]|nr:winged helix-turn-helix domain-containing protein [Solirubrobacterales bacterium]
MATTVKEQRRSIEEAVSFAVGHRIRIDALSILNEGTASPNEIAKMIGEGVSKVGHHVKELFDSGCIEFVGTEQRRGATEHFYRAIARPFISDEEARRLPEETKREFAALILQAIMAEGLASLRAGKMDSDDDIWMSWRSVNLDEQGRREVADEQAASYARIEEIEAKCASRLLESDDETGTSTVIAAMGFERSRAGRPPGERLATSET